MELCRASTFSFFLFRFHLARVVSVVNAFLLPAQAIHVAHSAAGVALDRHNLIICSSTAQIRNKIKNRIAFFHTGAVLAMTRRPVHNTHLQSSGVCSSTVVSVNSVRFSDTSQYVAGLEWSQQRAPPFSHPEIFNFGNTNINDRKLGKCHLSCTHENDERRYT